MSTPTGSSPPSVQVTVRRATSADWTKLAEFYQRCFPERTRLSDARLWRWQFVDQPAPNGELPFFVLEIDGLVEGAIGYLRLAVSIHGKSIAAVHPVNFFVNPKYTGLPALRLFRTASGEAPVVIGSYISGDARRLLQKSGFVDLGAHLQQYYAALRPAAAHTLRSRAVTYARLAWETVLGFYTRRRGGPVEYVMSKEIDPVWAQQAADWRCAECQVEKPAGYYAWRYTQSPVLDCAFIWQIQAGMPVGFAALHFNAGERTAVLLEWNTDGVALHRGVELLYAAIRFARSRHMDYLVTDAMSPSLDRALRWIGFGHRVSDLGFMVYGQDAEIRKTLSSGSNWHFMVGDTDRY